MLIFLFTIHQRQFHFLMTLGFVCKLMKVTLFEFSFSIFDLIIVKNPPHVPLVLWEDFFDVYARSIFYV